MELEEGNIYLNCVSIKPNGVLDVSLFILLCYGEYKGNDTKYTTICIIYSYLYYNISKMKAVDSRSMKLTNNQDTYTIR